MAFLAVLTADGGVPIFTRSVGETKTKLPFAAVGALNGVHLFSRLRNAELKNAATADEQIIWKEYHERLVLILITRDDDCSNIHIYNLLDNIFSAMVMLIGLDNIMKQGEVMKLQKALVISYPLVDCLLKQCCEETCNIGDLTMASDCFLSAETHAFQDPINQFLNVADSLYGCLYIKGKIAASSKDWWNLTDQERILLATYVHCLPKDLAREVVIYLPTSSPRIPNRLVTLNLLRDAEICVLCSSEPSIDVLAEEAQKVWMEYFDLLKAVSNLHPRNVSRNIDLDENILSLLLVNLNTRQSVCCFPPPKIILNSEAKSVALSSSELTKRQGNLRTLYKVAAGTYFLSEDLSTKQLPGVDCEENISHNTLFFNSEQLQTKEFYIHLQDYQCYVINEPPYQLYVIYNEDIPKYALKYISCRTLKKLIEKCLFPQT